MNTYSVRRRTIWDRLFPQSWPEYPERPGYKPGALTTHVEVRLGWLDRFRILISGRCTVRVKTITSIDDSKAESFSTFSVLPPTFKGGERG